MSVVVFRNKKPAELVVEHAEAFAKALADNAKGDIKTTKSQLRRFYQEYVTLRNRTATGGYEKSEVGIKMLIAKAAYAAGRQNATVPREFVEWLQANLKEIKCAADVEVFGDYFEAMMGYFYGAQKERSGGGRR